MDAINTDTLVTRFWDELSEVRTGMLGLVGAKEAHAQPMTAHFDGKSGPLWFYTSLDSELLAATGDNHQAVFHYAGPHHELYACVHGTLSASRDPTIIARFWGNKVARWFPDGPTGGRVALLRFEPREAEIWLPAQYPDQSRHKLESTRDLPVDPHGKIAL